MTSEQQEPSPKNPDKKEEKVVPLERSTRLDGQPFWTPQIIISIITMLLGPFVIWLQLSSEHSFVSRQKSEERRQSLLDEKKRLVGEVARLSGQMLGIKRQLAGDMQTLGLLATEKKGPDAPNEAERIPLLVGTYDTTLKAIHEDSVHLYSIFAEVRSDFRVCSFYFDLKAQEAIRKFDSIEHPWLLNTTLGDNPEEVRLNYANQIKAEDEYAKTIDEILDTLAAEVAGDLKSNSK